MKYGHILACSLCLLMTCGITAQAEGISSGSGTAAENSGETSSSSKDKNVVKYLSYYDISDDSASGYSEKLFREKYGGELEWYPTTWFSRYSDLSVFILGEQGIDFFPDDGEALPRGVISGQFQPVDDYIGRESAVWEKYADAMEFYNFKGKHYKLVTNVSADTLVIYNKETFRQNKLKDPYKLWKEGNWNWNTFKACLMKFTEADEEHYGLDGWFYEKALFLSAGKPLVNSSKGNLVSNIESSAVEKAMDYAFDLYENGLIMDKSEFQWAEQPQLMGEGKELFYIAGSWAVEDEPDAWPVKISPEDIGMVPVPSPKGSKNYMSAYIEGLCLCIGAENPGGAAQFAECKALESVSKTEISARNKTAREKYKWPEELISVYNEINAAARKYPVADLANGISADVQDLIYGEEIYAPFRGTEWKKEDMAYLFDWLVSDADDSLGGLS